jgi:hypothetical protein
MHDAAGPSTGDRFPRVPAYAWSWLQRSRPVLAEVSRRLMGAPPGPGFVEHLQERFDNDAFTRDVVVAVIADVAFNGRIPRHRPLGASWDRGLTWWAATIAGVSPAQFDASGPPVEQSRLFGVEEQSSAPPAAPSRRRAPAPKRGSGDERAVVVAGLRDLLRNAEDDRIPAAAVRSLLDQLEGQHSADGDQGR